MSWHWVGPVGADAGFAPAGGGWGSGLPARAARESATSSPCRAGAARSLKIRGEVTIFACSGCANGTWITSIRNSAEFGFESGGAPEHPASSLGDRTGADPDT